MTVSDFLLDWLAKKSVNTIFMVPGAHLDYIAHKIANDNRFELIIASHELGAAYMADGYARLSGSFAVVLSIGGPGATNMITSAITSKLDNIPVLYISGDAPSFLSKLDAFQNSGIHGSNVGGIYKEAIENSYCIDSFNTLLSCLNRFDQILLSPNRCPFHISLPYDISRLDVDHILPKGKWDSLHFDGDNPDLNIHDSSNTLSKLPNIPIKTAIFVGQFIRGESEVKLLEKLSTEFDIPVAVTLEAKGLLANIPEHLRLGVFGYAGSKAAFDALLSPDLGLLITIGIIYNERNTACWNPALLGPTRCIVDYSPPGKLKTDFVQTADQRFIHAPSVHSIYETVALVWGKNTAFHDLARIKRMNWLSGLKASVIDRTTQITELKNNASTISMQRVFESMQTVLPDDIVLFLDSGEHRYFAGIFWQPASLNHFFTASQTAPMGWAIAAAIGSSFVSKEKKIYVLTGDGCMLMHGMELAVAARYQCNIVFLVSNNRSFGRIKSRAKLFGAAFEEKISSLPPVDWCKVSEGLGVHSFKALTEEDLKDALHKTRSIKGPCMVDIATVGGENVGFPLSNFSSSTDAFMSNWHEGLSILYSSQKP